MADTFVVVTRPKGGWDGAAAPQRKTLHRAECSALKPTTPTRPPRDRTEAFILIDLGHGCSRCSPTKDDVRDAYTEPQG